ncbi:MAG: ABC transporter substrate-binding protein [Rhodospirillaceae bacterium]|nr:ABC transporter substrate-binding protein [Rhodospirillaceae bacterium]
MPLTPIRAAVLALIACVAPAAAQDVVKVARAPLPPSLGVPFTAIGHPSSEVWIALFDALTVIDPDGQLRPALALSWENPAPAVWRFRLRPGITFHNGAPFNAHAVMATLDLLRGPDGAKFYVSPDLRDVTAVRPVDDLTVEIETRVPDPLLPRRLSAYFIVEPGAWSALGEDGFAQAPIGTGPLTLVDWGRGSAITRLKAFPNSWRAPQVDEVHLYAVPEPVRRVQALLSGQVDIATKLGPEELRQLPETGVSTVVLQKPQVMSLTFRTVGNDGSPLHDVRVREALSLAVDRSAVTAAVFDGLAQAASQGTTPSALGFDPALPVLPYDPARARALLAEAGYPNGFDLQIEVFIGMLASDDLIYQQAAQNLREVGVNVELRTTTFPDWLRRFSGGGWGDIDAFSYAWDSSATFDASRAIELSSCVKLNPYFCEPALTPMIEAVRQEMNQDLRVQNLRALGAAVRNAYPAIWIMNAVDTYAAGPRVKGLEVWSMGIRYEKLQLSGKAAD